MNVRALQHFLLGGLILSVLTETRAEIPWPDVVHRLASENKKLERRPGGRAGEYFVVCTLYYTPVESGFSAERGFDAIPVTKPGLHGKKYPRDFLRSVKKEGFGRIIMPVSGRRYIRYVGGNSYTYAIRPTGSAELVPRSSAAIRSNRGNLRRGATVEMASPIVKEVFGSARWKIVDTGGGLRRWQIDLYYGDDEPRGPGALMARPRRTSFEYAYAIARTVK